MSVRVSTRDRVHRAVLELVAEVGVPGLTMEGVAARAGAGKQTIYRTWDSPLHVLLDALLTASQDADGRVEVPDTGDLATDLRVLVDGMVAELTDPPSDAMMRHVVALLPDRPGLGEELQERLLRPQVAAIEARFERAGVAESGPAAELLLGPVFHRWLLRTGPFSEQWIATHVRLVVQALST
ncbi:TetR/AcrR family transcriptional regulator [Aeromicrobium sp. Leaf350]|uniref:TetR/AcrR family transcriptional regulator n=1 Tax=Aeromicrobium sp. Leaf350 TaxID=2876565 RepID=UPI001E3DDFE5|nr:TetR/AcrR family transcriptional regulator [Aeromicrobium sp. Leaf350]